MKINLAGTCKFFLTTQLHTITFTWQHGIFLFPILHESAL